MSSVTPIPRTPAPRYAVRRPSVTCYALPPWPSPLSTKLRAAPQPSQPPRNVLIGLKKYFIILLQIAQGFSDLFQFDGREIPKSCGQFVVHRFKRGKIGIGC